MAHRPRDLVEIEGMIAAHPGLAAEPVRRWVARVAAALETPELSRDVEMRLAAPADSSAGASSGPDASTAMVYERVRLVTAAPRTPPVGRG